MHVKMVKAKDLRQVHKARTVFLPYFNLTTVELVSYRKSDPYVELTIRIGGKRKRMDVMPEHEIMVSL